MSFNPIKPLIKDFDRAKHALSRRKLIEIATADLPQRPKEIGPMIFQGCKGKVKPIGYSEEVSCPFFAIPNEEYCLYHKVVSRRGAHGL